MDAEPGVREISMTAAPWTMPWELLNDPGRVAEISPEQVPAMLGQLEELRALLLARLLTVPANGNAPAPGAPAEGDRLLTVEEAAHKLGASKDYLYRHAKALPFTVRISPRQLRFSLRRIERFIQQRQGR